MNVFLPLLGGFLAAASPVPLPDVQPPESIETPTIVAEAQAAVPGDSTMEPVQTSEAALVESERLAVAGASELALEVLGDTQPEYVTDPEAWRRHQSARIRILRQGERWADLVSHLRGVPDDIGLADRRWISTELAKALLMRGDAQQAMDELRALIWAQEPKSEEELKYWRRLAIRAWELADRLDAARTAIQRYQQDYEDDSRDWQIERARLALRVMAPEEAMALLKGVKGTDAEILALIAGLWSGQTSPAKVVDGAVKLGVSKDLAPAFRREAWAVAGEAAHMLNSREARIAALERGLVIDAMPDATPIVPVRADQLWEAYLQLGQQLGNQLQLIVGDDESWFLAASNRYDEQPIHARALFAVVAMKAFRPEQAAVAHWQLASLIDKIPHGGRLMRALYLESNRFETEADIPPAVRYLLLEHVLAVPDIPQASRLLVGLDAPPPQTEAADWHLRRARVLLLGGHVEEGIGALNHLFTEVETFDRDKALQVVFDLQTLERHETALAFFAQLQGTESDAQRARELWYWRADSLSALERHMDAALAYLRSAMLADPHAVDPWAQTARFRAAEELTAAGLFGDAHRQYQILLNSTRDASRQAVLRNNLQQLRLLEQREPAKSE